MKKTSRWMHRVVTLLLAVGLTGLAAGQEALPGDLDVSGATDATDVVVLQNYLAGNLDLIPALPGALYLVDPIVGNLRYVPGGTFLQGLLPGDPCGTGYFGHTLTLNLAVMETEVSRQMWADLLSVQPTLPADPTNPTYSPGMRHPVQRVLWYETLLFANLLSLEQGLRRCYYTNAQLDEPLDDIDPLPAEVYCDWEAPGYRLLTEGEWEYACRAGTTTPFSVWEPAFTPCDETCDAGIYTELEAVAWICANSGIVAHPVGLKAANPWGLKDMHGNVWEWCWDWAGGYPTSSQVDYRGKESGTNRLTRGGSFSYFTQYSRSAYRASVNHTSGSNSLGFRLARRVD